MLASLEIELEGCHAWEQPLSDKTDVCLQPGQLELVCDPPGTDNLCGVYAVFAAALPGVQTSDLAKVFNLTTGRDALRAALPNRLWPVALGGAGFTAQHVAYLASIYAPNTLVHH